MPDTDTILKVAELTKDYLNDPNGSIATGLPISYVGREFHFEAMQDWWGWDDMPGKDYFESAPRVQFKLYDDDKELYYEGWLLNDDECIVQQFVLRWAELDSGCTLITVKKDTGEWVQEIG